MTDPDDWEPLRSEQVAAHPGELVVVHPRPVTDPAVPDPALPAPAVPVATSVGALSDAHDELSSPTVPSAARQVRRAKADDPAAEQALLALKAKIAQRPAAKSLIAQVQNREEKQARKQERRQRAADAPQLAATVPGRLRAAAEPVGPAPAEPAPKGPAPAGLPVCSTGPDDELPLRDPREDETWFRGLPEAEQQRLVAAWSLRRERMKLERPGQLRVRRDRFVSALLAFAVVWLFGSGSYWLATVGSAILTGIAWQNLPACRFRDPILACVVYGLCQALAFLVSTDTVLHPGLVMDVLLLVPMAGLLGFSGEMRRTGGFDAD